MIFTAYADGWLQSPVRLMRCAFGTAGVVPGGAKREGDGATPAGLWALRRLLWREDRAEPPRTRLPMRRLEPDDGWCDAPGDLAYNRPVRLPYGASAEALWRDDRLYDLLVVLGYNDDPVVAGAGSAIFLHLARPDFGPTQGCVALGAADLLHVLELARPGDSLRVDAAARRRQA
ncbi:MAG TPA: L,D-transpeptidase family protein [Caulobacteraceae bacterium]|jgi:L,D-peptidoglycan transpeptidase YkuD (ErfK/YbiS/YcfS/YnhG family)